MRCAFATHDVKHAAMSGFDNSRALKFEKMHQTLRFLGRNPHMSSWEDFLAPSKTSDCCSAMCIAENHLYVAMHFHCDSRSGCGNPLRCRPRCMQASLQVRCRDVVNLVECTKIVRFSAVATAIFNAPRKIAII